MQRAKAARAAELKAASKSIKGWIIIHHEHRGLVEVEYFHCKQFYDKGVPCSRAHWMRKYRPDCTMVKATLTWKKPK